MGKSRTSTGGVKRMLQTPHIYIGTSGWHYKHWVGRFYPSEMDSKDFLGHFIKSFSTVELNNSFYHLPLKQTFRNWYKATPPGFIFAVKGSRYITHIKRLSAPQETTPKFFEVIVPLKEKLGVILFQLPPRWKPNPERLEEFLKGCPRKYRYTFELRDPSWFTEEIYAILRKYNAAFCMYDFNGLLSPQIITADFIYIRFHGPDGKYRGKYSDGFLKKWAKDFIRWRKEGIKDIYCYFDNDDSAYATEDALKLSRLVASYAKK
jgi:uncharacterized protein YecE (DUF72 family)